MNIERDLTMFMKVFQAFKKRVKFFLKEKVSQKSKIFKFKLLTIAISNSYITYLGRILRRILKVNKSSEFV